MSPDDGKEFELIEFRLTTLAENQAATNTKLDRMETKFDSRLDRLQSDTRYVERSLYENDKVTQNKRMENHFALIMAVLSLLITIILAFVGYLVVAA